MPENYDYPLNIWDFADNSGSLITIASTTVNIDELNSILGTINIVANEDNYTLMVNGRNAGTISISSQITLKNVAYNPDTKKIEFTFSSDEGDKTVYVDVSDLVDEYTAGEGLGLNSNQFFLKIDPSSEKYLSVSADGVKISGLDSVIKMLQATDVTINNNLVQAVENINKNMSDGFNTINGGIDNEIRPAIAELQEQVKNIPDVSGLEEKVDKNAADIATVNTNLVSAVDNINKNIQDGFNTINGGIDNEIRPAIEKNTEDITSVKEILENKVEYTDVATDQNPGRKAIVLNNHDVILGKTTDGNANNLIMMSKWNKVDVGSVQNLINLNGSAERPTYNDDKELALMDDINVLNNDINDQVSSIAKLQVDLTNEITSRKTADDALNTALATEVTDRENADKEVTKLFDNINLERQSDLEYSLKVGGRIAGTINIPKDQFLKDVSYDTNTKAINFVFETTDGEESVSVDISNLVDTYSNGDGLSLDANVFSIKLDVNTQKYIEVSADGIKIIGIDEALDKKVDLVDIADVDNPNRKAIVLENHDVLLGKGTDGTQYNLAMISKWNKADFGSASVPFNINGSEERPTYNDNEEIALMKDIEEIKLPIEFNFPIRTLQDKVYTQEEIFAWFGVVDAAELKGLIVREGQFYLKYGIQLSGNPYYYKMPIQYIAFESANQIKMVVIGLDTTNDMPTKYEIILNLDGTIAEGNSNIKVTSNDLAFATDMPSLDGYATEEWVNTQGFLKEHQDISNLATKDEVALKANQSDVDFQVNALNERIDAITVPTKVSELENDAQYQTSSEVDARIQAVVGAAPEALDTLEEIANKLSDNDDVVASLTTQIAEKATTEALNAEIEARSAKDTELQGNIEAEAQARIAKDTEIETELANKVAYTDVTTEENPNRKAIVLNNHDTLLGNTTSGSAVNIAMVSKWDKVDLGSTQVSINLNGKDARPTYNDDVQLALLSDVEAVTVPTKVSELENDSLYQTKDEVDAAIATKAEQADVDKIKDDLEQFKAPYEIDLNALNSAGDADSEAISTAIGGIDNLRAVISENRSIIGDINNGTVPVSIRILGNITTVYYVLDSLAGYTLNEINIQNTSGTLAKNSVTHSVMSEEMVVDNLTSDEATLPLSAKQGKVLDEKIQKKGMYYQGVKVDTQKLFALTKESTEDDIKAALQLETSSGSYTLPTAEILDDCLGKGYQLLSNWMPVSIVWNGAAYVFYIVGQNYMRKPTGLYTVALSITEDGKYSVFQAAKCEEFANVEDLNEYQKIDTLLPDDTFETATAKVANGVKTIIDKDGLQWFITQAYEGMIDSTNALKVVAVRVKSPYVTTDTIQSSFGLVYAQFTLAEGAAANSWSKVTSNGEFISEYTINNLIDEKLINVNNAITLLNDKVSILENKYNMILEENSESVADFVGGDTINDTTKSYSVSNANIESNSTINAKNIVLNDSTLSNNARLKVNSNNIEVNNLNISGNFPKENGNSVISLNDADYVVFKDMTFNSNNVYNGVEIGLNSEKLPKNILFENCKFEGTFSNNAILVFGTQNDATITLSNCTFDKLSNALRLSNKSNASGVTVNIINCSVNQWEETNKEYGGFLICEDYTSDASSVDSNNLFGNGKITVNFMNLTHKGEKVIYSNASRCCGTKDENQVVYVYADNVGFVNYSEDKYPIVTFK